MCESAVSVSEIVAGAMQISTAKIISNRSFGKKVSVNSKSLLQLLDEEAGMNFTTVTFYYTPKWQVRSGSRITR